MQVSSSIKKYGLFGWPVKHSVSPAMQGAGFQAIGLQATYELFEVAPEDLPAAVQRLRNENYAGWNITVPHKSAMIDLVDVVDPTALKIGSINTVVNRDGTLYAYSTDGFGLEMSIRRSFDLPLKGKNYLFWGCGGATRATACHFAVEGASTITLVNRTKSKAEKLAEIIDSLDTVCTVDVFGCDEVPAIQSQLNTVDVLIQATSVGLHATDPLSIPETVLRPGLKIVDMIYRPNLLSTRAPEKGCHITDGRDMLLYQGVKSFEIWTGEPAPVEIMGTALDKALGR